MQSRHSSPRRATPAKLPRRQSQRARIALAAVALATLVLICYGNSTQNGFVWDDNRQIVMNPNLRPGAPWTRLFTSDVWGFTSAGGPAHSNYYRPLQMVTYRLAAGWFGFNPAPFHRLSIVFAIAATLAAFWVYLLLTRRLALAFAAAAVFAVHPIHSEAIDWISALPDLGCALFVFLSLGVFLLPGAREGLRAALLWSLSLLLFAAALLWKETAAVLPLIVAGHAVCFEDGRLLGRARRALKLSLPYWSVLGAYLVVRARVLGFLATPIRIWDLSPAQAFLNMLHLMAQYWKALLIPLPLNAYHQFLPLRSLLDWRALLAVILVSALLAGTIVAARRNPLAGFAAAWTILALLPVMNIYGVGRNVMAERYLYLPSAGFCLLIVLAAADLAAKLPARIQKPICAAALAAVVVAGAVFTIRRNPDWQNDATLFRSALPYSPDAPFVHFMVAATDNGDWPNNAETHYLRAISLAERESPPDISTLTMAYKSLAALYGDRGDFDRGLQLLARARQANPGDADLDGDKGAMLFRAGRWQEAQPLLEQTVASHPNDENALNALGLLEWRNKQNFARAADLFGRALSVHLLPDDFRASLHNNLGAVYGEQRQYGAAAEQFRAAVRISPNNAEYRTNLANALAALGRYQDAIEEARLVLEIAPNFGPARDLLRLLQNAGPR